MRASLNLLKQYVDLTNISPEEIARKLTFSGLEVESLSAQCDATGLVIGQILECENHPSSDHLHILKVDLGPKYGIKQIVCGAPNARVGLKVIVARVGAELKSIPLKIVKSTIRGVESEGMCCALFELGVDKSYLSQAQIDGIEELPDNAIVGDENVLSFLNLDDYIFDINVLANRSDCLAIFSLAKELGTLFNRQVNIPNPHILNEFDTPIKVHSLTNNCPQFSIKLVKDIKVKESPSWLKNFLRSQGIRSINNVVDIGNFIMILTGQPLHMYDMDKLATNEFIVKDDYVGDFIALDDKKYSLKNNDLVIFNGDNIGCLAGIMGAKACAIDENSHNIAIESANFNGASVRRTSVRIGLSSDSSAHFIKGINPYQDEFVLALTAQMLIDLADAKVIYKTSRYSTINYNIPGINYSCSYINNRLGTNFSATKINEILKSLNIRVEKVGEDSYLAYPPQHRIDLKCNADLSEEVIRIAGLDCVKPTLPQMVTTVGGLSLEQRKRKKIREHLISNGLHEVLTYTLVSPELNQSAIILNNDDSIKIMNPMTVDHSLVRRGLLPSLLEVLNYNLSHQNKDVAIFEISDITTDKQSYQELSIVLNGQKLDRELLKTRNYDYYDVYGLFMGILAILGIDNKRYKLERLTNSPFFHPGRSASIFFGKKLVGVIGQLHPTFAKDYGDTFVLDLNLSEFINLRCSTIKMNDISRFPSVSRDYAFVLKKEILSDDIIKLVKKESHGIVIDVKVFDVYEGESLPNGFKSIAIKIVYSSLEKTLKDEEINQVEKCILNSLNKQFNAVLRQ